jgi:hypothetical protein
METSVKMRNRIAEAVHSEEEKADPGKKAVGTNNLKAALPGKRMTNKPNYLLRLL